MSTPSRKRRSGGKGGARPGSGRKRYSDYPMVRVTAAVTAEIKARMLKEAKSKGIALSKLIAGVLESVFKDDA